MRYKLICCEVFMREVCLAIALSPNIVDPEFTPKGAHEDPESLHKSIQSRIDAVGAADGYDAILLGYGLCGNSALGLQARTVPLVIPRAHDCCTIFLGSKEKFLLHFKDSLSAQWTSVGYMERGESYLRETDTGKLLGIDKSYEDLVEKYGEENAGYIWETLHSESHSDELLFIQIPETANLGHLEKFADAARENGKTVRVLEGDMRLLKGLVAGDWDEREYLVVPPGKSIKAVYDHEEIIST